MPGPQSHLPRGLRTALADLGFACAWAAPDDAGDLLRAAVDLIGKSGAVPSAATIDTLIAAGAHDALALALVEPRAGYMLSHAPGGKHLATVVVSEAGAEFSAEGQSAALALLGALASALAEGDTSGVPLTRGNDKADLRLN